MPDTTPFHMIATLGTRPQVITVALDKLLEQGRRPTGLDIIATNYPDQDGGDLRSREQQIKEHIKALYSTKSLWGEMKRGILPENPGTWVRDNVRIHPVERKGTVLKDIVGKEDHDAFMQLADRLVRLRGKEAPPEEPSDEGQDDDHPEGQDEPPPRLVALLAGGRKTMSSGLQEIMVLRGLPGDELLHVLMKPPWLDGQKGFWFRKPGGIETTAEDFWENDSIAHDAIEMMLVEVGFAPASVVFDYDELPISYEQAISGIRKYRSAPKTPLHFDLGARKIHYRGQERKLGDVQMAIYAALAHIAPARVNADTLKIRGASNHCDFKELVERYYNHINGGEEPTHYAQSKVVAQSFVKYIKEPRKITFCEFIENAGEYPKRDQGTPKQLKLKLGKTSDAWKRWARVQMKEILEKFAFALPEDTESFLEDYLREQIRRKGIKLGNYPAERKEGIPDIIWDAHWKAFKQFDDIDSEELKSARPERPGMVNITASNIDRLIKKIRGDDDGFFIMSDVSIKGYTSRFRAKEGASGKEMYLSSDIEPCGLPDLE